TALVVVFVVQAVGYVLSIGGVHSHAHGTSAAIIAIACTAIAIAVAYVLARLARWHWTRDWLVEQARWDQLGVRHDDPYGRELMGYALVLRKVAPEESYDDDLLRQAGRGGGIDAVL